jgi:hypothetical protein
MCTIRHAPATATAAGPGPWLMAHVCGMWHVSSRSGSGSGSGSRTTRWRWRWRRRRRRRACPGLVCGVLLAASHHQQPNNHQTTKPKAISAELSGFRAPPVADARCPPCLAAPAPVPGGRLAPGACLCKRVCSPPRWSYGGPTSYRRPVGRGIPQPGRISRHLSGYISNPPSGIFGFYFKGSAF